MTSEHTDLREANAAIRRQAAQLARLRLAVLALCGILAFAGGIWWTTRAAPPDIASAPPPAPLVPRVPVPVPVPVPESPPTEPSVLIFESDADIEVEPDLAT